MKRKKNLLNFPPLHGKMGDMVYYHLNGEYVARRAGKLSKEVYKTDPRFIGTRKEQTEFGQASFYGKKIRQGFHHWLRVCQDSTLSGRLTGALRHCIQQHNAPKGQRLLTSKNIKGLDRFPLHNKYPYGGVFDSELQFTLHETTQRLYVDFGTTGFYFHSQKGLKGASVVLGVLLLPGVDYQLGNSVNEAGGAEQENLYIQEHSVGALSGKEAVYFDLNTGVALDKMLCVGFAGYLNQGGHVGKGWLKGVEMLGTD